MGTLSSSIFRAYDIRGIVGEALTEEVVYQVGQVMGTKARLLGERAILTARDGRHSSPSLSRQLQSGILSTGCNVVDVGMVATPLLYYATERLAMGCGIMVTGSHNPAEYNGLKIVMQGKPLTESEIKDIYDCILTQDFMTGSGEVKKINITDAYCHAVQANLKVSRPLKIVVDAGNGVTGNLVPALYEALGCEVIPLFCEIDGRFPNHHPDPSDPHNMQALRQAVEAEGADAGLAFDGDGDRLGVVTNHGEIILPDRLLMFYAQALLKHSPHAKVIYDVKCTNQLGPFIRENKGTPIMWKTGHSLIKAKLAETNAALAGEMSGHFIFNDRWYRFDDAVYAGGRFLEILASEEKDCATIFATIPNSINTPELKVSVTEDEKFSLMQKLINQADFSSAHEVMTIDGLRVDFTDGWGLVRPSNTTPYLVLRFEAINEVILKNIQVMFRDLMLSVKPDLVLPF